MGKVLPLFAPPQEVGQIAVMRDGGYQVMSKEKQLLHFYPHEWRKADELATKMRETMPDDPEFDTLLEDFIDMNQKRPKSQRVQIRGGQVIRPVVPREKVGPNEPCPCGSGRKFKKCCG